MATPRRQSVNPDVPAVYHAFSRCVRRGFLLCGERGDRRHWVTRQLALVLSCFAFDLYSFAVMHNHFHLVVGNDPDRARSWSDHEVARRWLTLFPARWLRRKQGVREDSEPTEFEIDALLRNTGRLARIRRRLHDLSWFMKCIKEPIARRANREDDARGHFWEGRFEAFKVGDEAGLLATAGYVDLNETRAGIADTPEASLYSSAYLRAENAVAKHRGPKALGKLRRRRRKRIDAAFGKHSRVGRTSLAGLVLAPLPRLDERGYLAFLDATARQIRPGTRIIDPRIPPILQRLGIDAPAWVRFAKAELRRFRGSIAGTAVAVREEARRRGRRWLWNALAPLLGGAGTVPAAPASTPADLHAEC